MINYTILIGGVDYSSSCSLPFKEQKTLDESLDNGTLSVKMIARRDRFKPYTIVSITKNDGTSTPKTETYYVANDNVTEIVGTNAFNHDLTLIEETKMLEKIVVDTNTITQPKTQVYERDAQPIRVWIGYYPADVFNSAEIVSQSLVTTIMTSANTTLQLPSANEFLGIIATIWQITGATFEKATCYIVDGLTDTLLNTLVTTNKNQKFTITIPETGKYYGVRYKLELSNGIYTDVFYIELTGNTDYIKFHAIVDKNYLTQPKTTISDVVDRLLKISETQRYGDTPRFTFNAQQHTKYSTVIAPEFAFTKSTLRECLDQVGGSIHAITRLENGVVKFDELGQNEETELPTDYIGYTESQDIEQYCTDIDTNVDNIINVDNLAQGSVVSPYINGYMTPRIENIGLRITDETAEIKTQYPIYKALKVEIGILKDKTTLVGDITSFVWEKADYGLLSSYENNIPYSKAYALYYTQGEKNIKGLGFKLDDPISPVFSNQAIINICEMVTGEDLQNLFNVYGIVNLMARVTYIPIVDTRIKQSKSYLLDYDANVTSIYNQQANTVDCEAYGENLKGAVARLGNIEKTKTYMLPKVSQIPEVGTLVDEDYYVSVVNVENEPDYIKVTCGLSKDFNRLSKYVGIKNNVRMYEVSEKQSVERFVVYEDYCVIGDEIETNDTGLIYYTTLNKFVDDFSSNLSTHNAISAVKTIPQDNSRTDILDYEIVLPVVSLGVGNSILLSFKFEDNYSAGSQSVDATNIDPDGNDGDKFYKVAQYVPYSDYWGRFKYLKLLYYEYYSKDLGYDSALPLANSLPEVDPNITYSNSGIKFWTGDNPIYIDKDNREQINFSYQIHFVTNQKNMVIGSGISKNCGVTTNGARSRSLYILPKKIGKFDKDIDLTGATLVRNYNDTGTTYVSSTSSTNVKKITIANETANAKGKAWVIVDNATNKNGKHDLIFGKNIHIKYGDTISMPTMSFTHKIFD